MPTETFPPIYSLAVPPQTRVVRADTSSHAVDDMRLCLKAAGWDELAAVKAETVIKFLLGAPCTTIPYPPPTQKRIVTGVLFLRVFGWEFVYFDPYREECPLAPPRIPVAMGTTVESFVVSLADAINTFSPFNAETYLGPEQISDHVSNVWHIRLTAKVGGTAANQPGDWYVKGSHAVGAYPGGGGWQLRSYGPSPYTVKLQALSGGLQHPRYTWDIVTGNVAVTFLDDFGGSCTHQLNVYGNYWQGYFDGSYSYTMIANPNQFAIFVETGMRAADSLSGASPGFSLFACAPEAPAGWPSPRPYAVFVLGNSCYRNATFFNNWLVSVALDDKFETFNRDGAPRLMMLRCPGQFPLLDAAGKPIRMGAYVAFSRKTTTYNNEPVKIIGVITDSAIISEHAVPGSRAIIDGYECSLMGSQVGRYGSTRSSWWLRRE